MSKFLELLKEHKNNPVAGEFIYPSDGEALMYYEPMENGDIIIRCKEHKGYFEVIRYAEKMTKQTDWIMQINQPIQKNGVFQWILTKGIK